MHRSADTGARITVMQSEMTNARHFLCSFLWTSVYRLGAGVHAPENAEIRRDLDCRGWSPMAFTCWLPARPGVRDFEVAGGVAFAFLVVRRCVWFVEECVHGVHKIG